MIIETFPVGWLQCNCTILGDEQTREAIVIDPGDDPQEILTRLEKHGLTPKQILCTHTHIDHVGAIYELQERAGTPASIHKADLFLFEKLDVQAQWIGIPMPKRGAIEHFVEDGGALACHGVEVGVIHTPGHSPGHVMYYIPSEGVLVGGDLIIGGSVGRTALPDANHKTLQQSIRRVMQLPPDTKLLPGHGEITTLGEEKAHNPFVQEAMEASS